MTVMVHRGCFVSAVWFGVHGDHSRVLLEAPKRLDSVGKGDLLLAERITKVAGKLGF